MTPDFDSRLRTALIDAASTVRTTDNALSAIVDRSVSSRSHRRRILIGSLTAIGAVAAAGTAYAMVGNGLTSDQLELVETPTCGLSAESARLVATADVFGRTVDYWIVDGEGAHGDFVFERGDANGGGGCGPQPRREAHPTVPWASYMLDSSDGTGLFWFFGQAPPGATEVEVVMSTGSARAAVGVDGYFVTLAELPHDGDDQLLRVDALAHDGRIIATGAGN